MTGLEFVEFTTAVFVGSISATFCTALYLRFSAERAQRDGLKRLARMEDSLKAMIAAEPSDKKGTSA